MKNSGFLVEPPLAGAGGSLDKCDLPRLTVFLPRLKPGIPCRRDSEKDVWRINFMRTTIQWLHELFGTIRSG